MPELLSFAALLLLGFSGVAAQAQTLAPVWQQPQVSNSPPARDYNAMTYDQAHGQVVLFGGNGSLTSPGFLNDTWLWNGVNWTQASPATSPSARETHAMAYDAAHGQVVLFGGLSPAGNNLGDTWLWDGANWAQAVPANTPPARHEAVMAYDAATAQVLLFGGSGANGPMNDLWAWNGTTWTQQLPANRPSGRMGASMAYDAAIGQVILFGGYDGVNFLNDTWAWNGTNWVQQRLPNSPPAPFAQAMSYDDAQGKLVLLSGYNASHNTTDTWLYDGTTWTQDITAVNPPGRNDPNSMTYDSAHGQLVLFGGSNLQSQFLNDTWVFGLPGNFGNVMACSAGPAAPALCSNTLTLTYTFATTVNISKTQALMQGTSGLDFKLVSDTCTGVVVGGGSCSLNVSFAPSAPGLRAGAVQLLGLSGNVVASTPVYGTGVGPATAIGPGTQTAINTTANYPVSSPLGVAVDAANNVYIGDTVYHRVLKVTPAGVVTTVGAGLNYPQGLAVDGAGNLLVADNNLNQVLMIPAGCNTTGCQQVFSGNLRSQLGVAVDGAGNVFMGDFLDGKVVENPVGCTATGCQTTVYNPAGANPVGLAVDAAGDLFIADNGLKRVVEVPVSCTSSACQITVGQGWSGLQAVAVDAAGDVFVADSSLRAVIEVPAGCTASSCQTTVLGNVTPFNVAVDAQGNLFVADASSSRVLELNRSQPPSLSFATTNVSSTSSDSPQSIFLQNIGNQTLSAAAPGLVAGWPNFVQVAGASNAAQCSPVFALAPGAACNLSISFQPVQAGSPISTAAVFTDNALNATAATQTIPLSGIAVSPTFTLSVAEIGSGTGAVTDNLGLINCVQTNGASTGTCTTSYPDTALATLTAKASGTSVFLGWGGVCASAGTSPTCLVSINQAGRATASFVNQSFGRVNVCATGQSSSGNCSGTLPVTFNLANTASIGAIQVVTQGVSGLDFAPGTSTCTGTIVAGNSCTVNVLFTPLAAGLRLGAIQLFDKNGSLVGTTPIYGVGQEPEIAFGPGTQAIVSTGNLSLSQPKGITVDAAGDVFIADTANQRVVKVAANGTASTLGVGLNYPQGLAVDGAGDLLIADNSLNQVLEVPAGCTTLACQKTVGIGLSAQLGVGIDGAGDAFIASLTTNQVVEVPAGCTSSACQTVVYNNGSQSSPGGMAVDAAGDLFVADSGLAQVLEVPAGCTNRSCQVSIGQGWAQPVAVAVDAAGDVFVSDKHKGVVEVPAGCTSSACQTTVLSGITSAAVAVDGAGNIFVPELDTNQVVKLNRSQPPSLNFAVTNAGATSSDSPQTVIVQNIGNQPLTGALALSLGGNFSQTLAPDCTTRFPLAPGATCGESFSFTPQSATFFSGTAAFSNNALNTLPAGTQTITLTGTGGLAGQAGTVAVPDVVGQAQTAVSSPFAAVGLVIGSVTTATSTTVPTGSVISQNPAAGTQVSVGSPVNLLVSSGQPQPPSANPLTLQNNYFLTGDYVSAGVTLRGTGKGGNATGTITIQSASQGVPDGADIVGAFLYWETVESTPTASSTTGFFNKYPITGQQIGNDLPNYTDGQFTGTLRVYRADVNLYLPVAANGLRSAAGQYTVSLPDSGGTALPLTQGASLVLLYRVLSPNFPLKSVVIYDGSALPTNAGAQVVQGFYDAVGGASGTGKSTTLSASNGSWNTSVNNVTLGQAAQYSAPLYPGKAYAAVILSTPVNNSDNDGILDAWKAGPASGDFHAGQPGYYDAKTGTWVGLPGAKHGQKDLFVQLDYMCGALLADGSCDPTQENLFPSPDTEGKDPLAMVQQAFAASGVQLHLTIGNAVPESTCTDDLTTTPATLCQFPNKPGVVGWKNSLEFSKLYPRNLLACLTGGDCTTRFPFGQKDSYHYVLMGHSLAIPAWNTRYGTLTSITVANGVTTIGTADRGTGINACPGRITLSGVLGNPGLNGVYNTTGCADSKTISLATPGVPNWSYPNSTLPEPVIGLTSGNISSISGYSDLGGADSAVTLGLWLTAPNQDMSKRANVIAGTLFHEIGHTLGLSHGGLYYDTPGSYVPTFDANCKPNYQSVMNYLFQLDLLGPNNTLAFSNQTLLPVNENAAGSVLQLADASGNPATFPTSAWYVPFTAGAPVSPATLHCDGTPLNGEQGYRVDAPISPIAPAWTNGQDLSFTGTLQSNERGFNDLTNMDLRQVGATGGEFASLATLLSFGSSVAPLNISSGGNVTLGSGGTITLGSGGNVTIGSGGNVTLGSGGTIALGSGGTVTLGSGGNVTLGSGGTVTPGSGGTVTLGSRSTATLGSGGTITLGSGGNITLGSGGTVTLGSGGTITLGGGGTVTIPSSGGSYSVDAGGTVTLGSGGNVTLGSGGDISLGSGGTITLGSGGNVTLGSGGNVTLGSGGTVTMGSGGNVTLSSGGNVTLGSGGTITLGSGGTVTLGSGGNVTLGSGGTVTLGSGGNTTLGSGGNVTLGSGGTATLGAGGTVTLGSGGNVTLGSGGNVTLGSGGTITLGSGGNVTLGSGGTITLGSGGNVTLGSGGNITLGSGGNITLGSGGTITLGSGGTVTLGSGGTLTVGGVSTAVGPGPLQVASGGTITLGSGGNVNLGIGGNFTLGSGGNFSGGNVTLGSGGNVTLGSGGTVTLGSGGNITLGSGGNVTLGSGGTVTLGSGGTITLGSGGTVTLGSGGVVTLGNGGSVLTGSGSQPGLGNASTAISGTPASAGPVTTELTYETANSIVRPPSAPTETPTPAGVRITWKAPAFGVVQTYTILRSSDGATPIVIGSVSGVNGHAPATEFTDTNPDLTSKTVVYTISTTLVPDTAGASRQSAPSPPAVLKNDQSIALGPLPSSVLITNPPTVTATAMSGGAPNGLQIVFSATGSCSIGSQSVSNNVSLATVTLNTTGSCTILASQPGTNAFNAANTVSGIFLVLPQGSGTQSQTINFPTLQNVQYGNTFSLSATSSAGLPVSFAASGPCTTNGTVSAVGICKITASAPARNTYSASSLTQSFIIYPAVLTVTANNLTSTYGQPLPSLTYSYSGFVNGDTASVINGTPALSTTALATSSAGSYPITVSTGTLATTNYSFLYASGALTVQPASQSALTLSTSSPLMYNQSETLSVAGGSTSGTVTYNVVGGGPCSINGSLLTATSGTGTCQVTATMAGNSNYNAVTSTPATVTLSLATQTITFTATPPASAVYNTSFTVAATGGASPNPLTFTSAGSCTNTGAVYRMTSGAGTCSVIANQGGNANYSAATQVVKAVSATPATPVITWPAPAPFVYGTPLSATQLNATASVPGTLIYTPPLGTVLPAGTQTLAVTFTPTDTVNYSAANATVKLTVNPATVTLGISSGTQIYQQWTNLVIGPIFTGSRVPTGTVTLYDNGVALTTLTLGGNGMAYYTASPFNVGPNVLTASYSGNSYFAPGQASPVTVTVLPAPVRFQASCYGAQVYGSAYQCTVNLSASTTTVPGGVITYSFDGGFPVSVPIVNGNAPFTVPGLPTAGNHTLVLSYAAQGNFAAAGPLTESFTTQPGQTQVLASPSSYSPVTGSSLTISGTVTTPTSGTPTGSVTVYDGNSAIGTAPISSTGAISYKVASITKGPHSYHVSYPGSANYTAATSSSFTVTAK